MKKLSGIILFLLATLNMLSAYTGWKKNIPVSFSIGKNKYPVVSVSDNKIYACWVYYKKNIPHIFYSYYSNNKWATPISVVKLNAFKLFYPTIKVFNEKVYIAYSDVNNNLNLVEIKSNHISNTKFSNINNIFMPKLKIINNKMFLFYEYNKSSGVFNINYISLNQPDNEKVFISDLSINHGFFFPKIKKYDNKIYSIWVNRKGEGHNRYDRLFLKINNMQLSEKSKLKVLSGEKEDVTFADFYLKNNKLFLSYIKKEVINNELRFSVQFKTYSLNDFSLINISQTNLKFNNYYRIKLYNFKNKFYLFFYSYKKRQAHIYYSTSDNFFNWSKPVRITKSGLKNRNYKILLNPENNLSIIYEKEYNKNKSVLFYIEKDNVCDIPVVFSPSHKSNEWSYNKNVILKWKSKFDDSGIKGYSYIIDDKVDTVPDVINIPFQQKSLKYTVPANGIYYFHLRAVDNSDNWSKTVTYKFMVNSDVPEAPIISSPTHKEFIPSDNLSPVFEWKMKDNRKIKGYSYIITQNESEMPKDKINIKSQRKKFNNISPGVWYFKVKACDPFNRWTEYSTFTINIEKILIASGISEDVKSRYTYTVGNGENLVSIINKVLQLTNSLEYRKYIKGVAHFNYLQNYDYLKPGDKIMFPIILAKPGDTKEKISKNLFGDERYSNLVVIVNKPTGKIMAGDKIIIKDRYFLETGDIKKSFNIKVK